MEIQYVFLYKNLSPSGEIFGTGTKDYRLENNIFSLTKWFVIAACVF